MINSLSKDSHITHSSRHSISTRPVQGRVYGSVTRTASDNIGITVRKPAEISFSGLSSATIANSKELKAIIESARKIVGNTDGIKQQNKAVVKLIQDTVAHITKSKSDAVPSNTVKSILDIHEDKLNKLVEDARELTKKDNVVWIDDLAAPGKKKIKMIPDPNDPSKMVTDYRLSPEEIEADAIKSIGTAAEVFPAVEKPGWMYTNKGIQKALELAEKNNVAFSAAFALLLTCILRPASIMGLPGKKDKDDKKYASAHSIASGVIGFIISTAVSNPVADGLKKLLNSPHKHMKLKADYLNASKKAATTTKTWVTRVVDIGLAPAKAMLTIALIPPILKYVFGWEKKSASSSPNAEQKPLPDYTILNFKSANITNKQAFQNFRGVA